MRGKFWPRDTIALRFATTILLAIAVAMGLTAAVVQLAGVWALPPAREMGLLDRADDIVRMIEAVPQQERQSLAGVATGASFSVDWYSPASTVAVMLGAAADMKVHKELPGFSVAGHRRRLVVFDADAPVPATIDLRVSGAGHPNAHFLAVELRDGSWVVFTALAQVWGLQQPARIGIVMALLLVSIIAVSAIATYQLSRPIEAFTAALRRFGTDPRASPVPETGPRELRASIGAFNAMQAQIQRFVDDRTAMLAAISHDLRTPLTKMRLRGEYIENEEQRARLFRDVDDMQAMVDSALAFFRDDFQNETATVFDFSELLRTVADDYGDQGHPVAYGGAERVAFLGRPFALKRAFTNLVDNAIKYGRAPELELVRSGQRLIVMVRDSGPGIPPEAAERVFRPFYRLEPSRNRATGGVGLGLTSARAVIRAHGGDITLSNRPSGGLEVRVGLPELLDRPPGSPGAWASRAKPALMRGGPSASLCSETLERAKGIEPS